MWCGESDLEPRNSMYVPLLKWEAELRTPFESSKSQGSWEAGTSPGLSEAIWKISFSHSSFIALDSTKLTYLQPSGMFESMIFPNFPFGGRLTNFLEGYQQWCSMRTLEPCWHPRSAVETWKLVRSPWSSGFTGDKKSRDVYPTPSVCWTRPSWAGVTLSENRLKVIHNKTI